VATTVKPLSYSRTLVRGSTPVPIDKLFPYARRDKKDWIVPYNIRYVMSVLMAYRGR
jgi:hypothetical protein